MFGDKVSESVSQWFQPSQARVQELGIPCRGASRRGGERVECSRRNRREGLQRNE